jgi:hypothetical protein
MTSFDSTRARPSVAVIVREVIGVDVTDARSDSTRSAVSGLFDLH